MSHLPNETLENIVDITYATNKIALNKTLGHLATRDAFCVKSCRIGSIAEKIAKAVRELRLTLAPEYHDRS